MDKKQITYRKTDELIPYARNARTHSDKQVLQIAASIKEFGFTNPILIDADNNVIAGHGRLLAAKKLHMDKVPSIVCDGWTKAQTKAYILADNKLALNAGWDDALLALELQELQELDFNLDIVGFNQDELDALLNGVNEVKGLTDEDDAPEVQEKVTSVLGDIWLLGNHRVMCGDSTKIDDVERLMDGQKADLLLTDPPYGVSYASKNKSLNSISPANRIQRLIINDHMSTDETGDLFLVSFGNAHLCTKGGACYYIFGPQGGELMMMMMMMIQKSGWQIKHMMIWAKNNHVLGRMDYHYQHEPVLYGWKDKETHKFYGDKSQTSIWKFDKPVKSDLHPTMKPINLLELPINNSTKSGDTVLDLFGGSGSTLIACEKTNRNCRMMELDSHYVDVIVKRWQNFTGKKAIHADTGVTFDEASNGSV